MGVSNRYATAHDTTVGEMRLVCVVLVFLGLAVLGMSRRESGYADSWAVEVSGGEVKARELAEKHGFVYRGQVSARTVRYLGAGVCENLYLPACPGGEPEGHVSFRVPGERRRALAAQDGGTRSRGNCERPRLFDSLMDVPNVL